MRRIIHLLAGTTLVLFAAGSAVARQLPDATVEPRSGPAGTTVTISVSVYSPNTEIFVYEGGDDTGTLLGTGMTGPDGTGSFPITIPVDAPVGSYLMYICGLCDAQFPEWATRGFTVTESPGTTTTSSTTTAPTTTTTTTAVTSTSDATTTTRAAAPSTTMEVPPVVDDSSSGLILVLAILAGVVAVAFVAVLLSGRRQPVPTSSGQPPPPPPPAAP
jgi:hypothetical protein